MGGGGGGGGGGRPNSIQLVDLHINIHESVITVLNLPHDIRCKSLLWKICGFNMDGSGKPGIRLTMACHFPHRIGCSLLLRVALSPHSTGGLQPHCDPHHSSAMTRDLPHVPALSTALRWQGT